MRIEEEGVSEEEARDHIKDLICDSMKKFNKLVAHSSLPTGFAETALAMISSLSKIYKYRYDDIMRDGWSALQVKWDLY
ncbi:hypothetical protein GOBAR_DD28869 [Gossypium barbadense]|nr:hypothetical protein GOBAR_DD28869 [Gossypium barbadense]